MENFVGSMGAIVKSADIAGSWREGLTTGATIVGEGFLGTKLVLEEAGMTGLGPRGRLRFLPF